MEGLLSGNQLLLVSATEFKQFVDNVVTQLRKEIQQERHPHDWLSVADVAREFSMTTDHVSNIIRKILKEEPDTDAIIDVALNEDDSCGRAYYRIKRWKIEEYGRKFQKKTWAKSKRGLKAAA